MADVQNGRVGHLLIADVHDGDCGVQEGVPLVIGFKPNQRSRRPERATEAVLDGAPHRILSVTRSKITNGFYLLTVEPAE